MRILIILFSLFFGTFAMAQSNDKLTIDKTTISASDLQKVEEILKKGQDAVSTTQQIASDMADPAKLNEWVNLGKNLGQALASTAKELGTGAIEFSKTPLGILATFMIVWKVFAGDVVLLFMGLLTLVVGNTILYRIYRNKNVEILVEGPWYNRTKYEKKHNDDVVATDAEKALFVALLFANNVIGVIAMVNVG